MVWLTLLLWLWAETPQAPPPAGTTVSGTIRRGDGTAAQGAVVMAVVSTLQNGQMKLLPLGTSIRGAVTQTDENGRYQLENIPPGSFLILAGGGAQNREGPGFYPGTPDVNAARPIRVGVEPVAGLDFAITKLATVRVEGSVINAISGEKARGATVTLTHQVLGMLSQRVAADPNGNFEFAEVFAGDYALYASDQSAYPQRLFTSKSIAVGERNLEGIELRFRPTFEIAGQVTVENRPRLPNATPPMTVNAGMVGGTFTAGGSISPEGRFVIRDLVGGSYRFSVDRLPEDLYVKAIALETADLLSDALEVEAAPPSELQITLAAGSRVSGVVDPPNARVYLIPRAKGSAAKFVTSGPTGEFTLRGVAPGNYLIFASKEAFFGSPEVAGTAVTVPKDTGKPLQLVVKP
jgi:hypothetical protein